ncbi:hypothetical protein ACTWQF_18400 [Streptomyces sp. 8N114]|uniref:hypothetical protein n=1 Tax=Streptomyces sp. 8N114 TaxID=3457419 RepID=UPI003FCFED51
MPDHNPPAEGNPEERPPAYEPPAPALQYIDWQSHHRHQEVMSGQIGAVTYSDRQPPAYEGPENPSAHGRPANPPGYEAPATSLVFMEPESRDRQDEIMRGNVGQVARSTIGPVSISQIGPVSISQIGPVAGWESTDDSAQGRIAEHARMTSPGLPAAPEQGSSSRRRHRTDPAAHTSSKKRSGKHGKGPKKH